MKNNLLQTLRPDLHRAIMAPARADRHPPCCEICSCKNRVAYDDFFGMWLCEHCKPIERQREEGEGPAK